MGLRALVASALVAGAAAQVASFTNSDHSISVHVPSDTASSRSGPIYFQITAPSGTTWTAFGQGRQMAGANMFMIYANGSDGVTLSTRAGRGHVEPNFDSSIQATLLEGSGVSSDGGLIANVRCDSCLSWSGGSMDPTSSSANWIMAYKAGDALNSNSQSAEVSQHDSHDNFQLDLTSGTGDQNPILQSASPSNGGSSGSPSSTGAATPIASNNPNTDSTASSGGESTSSSPKESPFVHGVIMSLVMVGLLPLSALTLYLPTTKKVRFIHAPLNVLSIILLVVGLALGVTYGKVISMTNGYHQIIGYVVFALIVLPQPVLGLYQHLHFHKTGQRSALGPAHQWLGRLVLVLGIINGGLGWNLTNSRTSYIVYGVLAGFMFLVYVAVVLVASFRSPKNTTPSAEKAGLTQSHSEANSSRDGSAK